jgi:hypothetical protein
MREGKGQFYMAPRLPRNVTMSPLQFPGLTDPIAFSAGSPVF